MPGALNVQMFQMSSPTSSGVVYGMPWWLVFFHCLALHSCGLCLYSTFDVEVFALIDRVLVDKRVVWVLVTYAPSGTPKISFRGMGLEKVIL